MTNEKEQFLTVRDVSRELNRCDQTVREYSDTGKLKAIRTAGGVRLFRLSDVREFAKRHLQSQAGTVSGLRHKSSPEKG